MAPTFETLLYDVHEHVATVTINRPDRRNALSWTVMTELRGAIAAAKADRDVHVVVITGAGDRAFSAGADLSGMAEGAGFADLHDARGELARLFRDVWELGKPTIARVRGFALAGGFGVALMCDFVIAAEDAQFGTPEIDVGLWPMMITVPLMRSMPPKKALELMLTGRRVGAAEAERIGFVNSVVPVAELDAAVDEFGADVVVEVAGHRQTRPRRLLRRVGPGGRRRAAPPASALDPHDPARRRDGGHRRVRREEKA